MQTRIWVLVFSCFCIISMNACWARHVAPCSPVMVLYDQEVRWAHYDCQRAPARGNKHHHIILHPKKITFYYLPVYEKKPCKTTSCDRCTDWENKFQYCVICNYPEDGLNSSEDEF